MKYIKILGITLGIYILLVAILFVTQRSFIYMPFGDERPDIGHAPWMTIAKVTTEDGLALEGWFQQPIGDDKPTIVMFHGNAHSIGVRLFKTPVYLEHHYGLLMAEYRGYGGNPGKPTEDGLYKDGRAYMQWVIEEKGIPPEHIVLYGESLGAAVALQMANEYKVRGVVLEVPFNRAIDVAQSRFFYVPFLKHLMWDQFDNVRRIQALTDTPIMIGLAGEDMVIPNRFGKALFDAANEPKSLVVLQNSGHNSMYDHGFANNVVRFIESLADQDQSESKPTSE